MANEMDASSLKKMKKKELLDIAKQRGITNISNFKKNELVNILSKSDSSKTFSRKTAKTSLTSNKQSEKKIKDALLHHVQSPTVTGIEQGLHTSHDDVKFSRYTEVFPSDNTYTLPHSYNVTKLVAIVRDPQWVYMYWDFDQHMQSTITQKYQEKGNVLRSVIRIHDVTNIIFDGNNSHHKTDIDVDLNARSWYLQIGAPNASYIFDLGIIDEHGNFFLIARSNCIHFPLDGPSDLVDEKWMSLDFEEIYAASGGYIFGGASGEMRRRKWSVEQEWLTSGMISSPMNVKNEVERDFFLEVATELIVYGKTKPDAELTVAGHKIPLRSDGSFTLRYELPDGCKHLPVVATSSDKIDTRKITITVNKNTK